MGADQDLPSLESVSEVVVKGVVGREEGVREQEEKKIVIRMASTVVDRGHLVGCLEYFIVRYSEH